MKLVLFVEYRPKQGRYALLATYEPVQNAPELVALLGAGAGFEEAPVDATEGPSLPHGTFVQGVPEDMSQQLEGRYFPVAARHNVRCAGHMDGPSFERFLEHVQDPPASLRAALGAVLGAFDEEKARVVWWIEKM